MYRILFYYTTVLNIGGRVKKYYFDGICIHNNYHLQHAFLSMVSHPTFKQGHHCLNNMIL